MQEEEFESGIHRWLALSGSDVNVVIERRFPGRRLVGGKYSPSTHTVTLFRETIREQCLQLLGTDIYAEAFGVVIFAHELGHAEDRRLAELSEQLDQAGGSSRDQKAIALKIEQNAWDYAARLLSDSPYTALLQEVVYQSLGPYYKALAPLLPAAGNDLKHKQPASA